MACTETKVRHLNKGICYYISHVTRSQWFVLSSPATDETEARKTAGSCSNCQFIILQVDLSTSPHLCMAWATRITQNINYSIDICLVLQHSFFSLLWSGVHYTHRSQSMDRVSMRRCHYATILRREMLCENCERVPTLCCTRSLGDTHCVCCCPGALECSASLIIYGHGKLFTRICWRP